LLLKTSFAGQKLDIYSHKAKMAFVLFAGNARSAQIYQPLESDEYRLIGEF
jgi:hypothetical protein